MAFFTIVPRNNKFLEYTISPIVLNVIQDKGIDITPDFDVSLTDLNNGYKHFKVNNGRGDTFKISIIIHKNATLTGNIVQKQKNTSKVSDAPFDYWSIINGGGNTSPGKVSDHMMNYKLGKKMKKWKLTTVLNYLMRTLTPLTIRSDMIGINQSIPYIITKNKSRQQDYLDYTVWELEFTRYDKLKYSNFTKTSKGVKNALKKAKSNKSKKVSAKTKERLNLRKCKWQTLKFSKTKKIVPCVKILQKVLNMDLGTKLVLDGWFGKATSEAVAKYQSKYSKKFGLKKTGHMNLSTYNVMIGKGKQIKNNSVKGSSKTSKNKNSTNKSNKNSKSNSKNKRR